MRDDQLFRSRGAQLQSGVAEEKPGAEHFDIIVNIQHLDHAIEEDTTVGEILIGRNSAHQAVNHSVLGAHRGVPRLVDGRSREADSTGGFAVVRGAQPSLCKAGSCMVLTVHASHRQDERQFADIGQSIDIRVGKTGGNPTRRTAVSAIGDNTCTAVHASGDH